uniref:Kinesin motor domain-containing protein n=1 Tax=Chaetoceros debilis TaxID=122233 RepID=A0A7S3VBP7_9STRA|mmetsp:Transcript_4642/g.6456  ORF Transcript_4642/g.6456 Transcript_4642/m.6456 type:complete len:1322 (-) Transcript_4642:68-4033(-)
MGRSRQSPDNVLDRKVLDFPTQTGADDNDYHPRKEYGVVAPTSRTVNGVETLRRDNELVTDQHMSLNAGEKSRRSIDDNLSVQVAVRIRPLLGMETDQECVYVSGHDDDGDQQHYRDQFKHQTLRQTSSGDTTITTVPGSIVTGYESSGNNQLHPVRQNNYQTVQVGHEQPGGLPVPTYTFDHVLPSHTSQRETFSKCVTPLVESCLEGYNATVLAYGQTGSGKTHTVLGDLDSSLDGSDGEGDQVSSGDDQEGVIPRSLRTIFRGLEKMKLSEKHQPKGSEDKPQSSMQPPKQPSFEYNVKIQFLELYGEEIRDLLDVDPHADDNTTDDVEFGPLALTKSQSFTTRSTHMTYKKRPKRSRQMKKKITIRDGKIGEDAEVLGVSRAKVQTANEALRHLQKGLTKRVVGRTAMNATSSRSHAIFTIVIQQTRRSAGPGNGSDKTLVEMKTSKIHFVDLCGSERITRAKTEGIRLKEGIDINKGLLVLGNVISALGTSADGSKAHVPYRDSKLTRLLKGSLGGNHKTLMIACISPSISNASESINTLRYANRAKNIKNHAKINVDPASRVVNELRDQVAALAAELLRLRKTDDEETYPFSVDFLTDLMGGTKGSKKNNSSSWATKFNEHKIKLDRETEKKDKEEDTEHGNIARPFTAQGLERPALGNQVSWNLDNDSNTTIADTEIEHEEDGNSTVNHKNIRSYDFALATLRNTIDQVQTSRDSIENYNHDLSNVVTPSPRQYEPQVPVRENLEQRSLPKPALKNVRNIDELYSYLNDSTYINEKGDLVDEEGTVVSEVVTDHVAKLDGTISQNELLLKEMISCQELFESMKIDNDKETVVNDEKLKKHKLTKRRLTNAITSHDEDSTELRGLLDAVRGKKKQIFKLEKKQKELQKLNKTSDENKKNLEQLHNSVEEMKSQRNSLSRIRSRPPSRASASLHSNPTSYDDEVHLVTPHRRSVIHSERTVPRRNLTKAPTPENGTTYKSNPPAIEAMPDDGSVESPNMPHEQRLRFGRVDTIESEDFYDLPRERVDHYSNQKPALIPQVFRTNLRQIENYDSDHSEARSLLKKSKLRTGDHLINGTEVRKDTFGSIDRYGSEDSEALERSLKRIIVHANKNASTKQSFSIAGKKVPSVLNLDASVGNVSNLDTPGILLSSGEELSSVQRSRSRRRPAYRRKYHYRSIGYPLETHHERESPVPTAQRPMTPPRRSRRTRVERQSEKFGYMPSEPLSYKRIHQAGHRSIRSPSKTRYSSRTRSVFEAVDEANARVRKSPMVYDLSVPVSNSFSDDSEGDELCAFGPIANAFKKLFGFHNPAVKHWDV